MAGRPWALAALATSVYPLHVFTASTFYPETLVTALLLGGVLCAAVADETKTAGVRGRTGWFGASGVLLSLLILTSPTYAVAALVVLLWFAWRHRRAGLAPVCAFLILLSLPVAVWTVRTAVAMRAFVPVTTGTGTNLLLGNSEHTTADAGVFVDISRDADIADKRHLGEVARDRYYRSAVSTTSRTTLVEVQSSSARNRSTTSAHSTDCTRGASHRPHEAGSWR